ncbi:hypothetical protein SAMN04487926_101223 [Paraburkholderia steynii]|uniref:Uncharacterized protein n=1 Tax=Paraburkholderia steynii TaxID=1245441 RepID=A0A7Z7B4B8_9BURK|nr:hypothetical protein SAMN04487926_101223 [Paraburkholderia steynii]
MWHGANIGILPESRRFEAVRADLRAGKQAYDVRLVRYWPIGRWKEVAG